MTKPQKKAKRVIVTSPDHSERVKVTIKTRPPKKPRGPMSELIRQAIADRTFI
jgi:hypothetical protein